MDSLTHIALGAVIGEVCAGKSLGRKAMLIGAAAQSFPDIDFVLGFFNTPVDDLLAHRGITHSFVFGILATIGLAYLMKRFVRGDAGFTLRHWIIFIGIEILMHLTLDSLNSYGTGLLEPFTTQRISFNVFFVADPLFTIWSLAGIGALLIMKRSNPKRLKVAVLVLAISAGYLGIALTNKIIVNSRAEKTFAQKGLNPEHYFTSPTPLNILLWYVVAEADSGFYIGYSSVFDRDKTIHLEYYPQNNHLLKSVSNHDEVAKLKRFSQGYYTIEKVEETVVFNDLRFGQIAGWDTPRARFVFYFFLEKPDMNLLVVQRGRFTGWNKRTFRSFWNRIRGN
ncbi:MAG TPA: metal-dependent hydrolase [Cyclobacteriaceae bacterium]|nr:metal-dependent hydrolase [Cyclobacteriaceae bacterium]